MIKILYFTFIILFFNLQIISADVFEILYPGYWYNVEDKHAIELELPCSFTVNFIGEGNEWLDTRLLEESSSLQSCYTYRKNSNCGYLVIDPLPYGSVIIGDCGNLPIYFRFEGEIDVSDDFDYAEVGIKQRFWTLPTISGDKREVLIADILYTITYYPNTNYWSFTVLDIETYGIDETDTLVTDIYPYNHIRLSSPTNINLHFFSTEINAL